MINYKEILVGHFPFFKKSKYLISLTSEISVEITFSGKDMIVRGLQKK